jgi:hypothetical protein
MAKSRNPILLYTFGMVVGLTVLVWLLRGLRVLTFIPGGVIWILILLSVSLAVVGGLQSSKRW